MARYPGLRVSIQLDKKAQCMLLEPARLTHVNGPGDISLAEGPGILRSVGSWASALTSASNGASKPPDTRAVSRTHVTTLDSRASLTSKFFTTEGTEFTEEDQVIVADTPNPRIGWCCSQAGGRAGKARGAGGGARDGRGGQTSHENNLSR